MNAQERLLGLLTSWPGARPNPDQALEALLGFLERVPGTHEAPRYERLNAQVSVDTAAPHQLRLTIDPTAGSPIHEDRLTAVLRATGCRPLLERTLRLFGGDEPLPQSFWVGIAPESSSVTVKGYVAGYNPICRQAIAHHARRAEWLPPRLDPAAISTYERLTTFGALEGIGIAFRNDQWLGTTLYVRATAPWLACVSPDFFQFAGLEPAAALETLACAVSGRPQFFGWSIEVNRDGGLVDIKLECAVRERFCGDAIAAAREFGIDASVFNDLGCAIGQAGLSAVHPAVPAIISFRFRAGELRSMISYFALTARDEQG